jgi:hypothetical protein
LKIGTSPTTPHEGVVEKLIIGFFNNFFDNTKRLKYVIVFDEWLPTKLHENNFSHQTLLTSVINNLHVRNEGNIMMIAAVLILVFAALVVTSRPLP